jgi:RES domain-containing protein
MLQLENPQDQAMEYALHIHQVNVDGAEEHKLEKDWQSVVVPSSVKLATDPRNPLKQYY